MGWITTAAHVSPKTQALCIGAPRGFSFALLAAAGWSDAVGFLMFAQLYVSFMSGDATQLGSNAGGGKLGLAAKFLIAQAVFVFGALLGRQLRLSTSDNSRLILLGVNAVLLALVALFGDANLARPAFVLAVLAIGAQNTILHTAAGVPIGSMVTGMLVRLGEDICDRLHGRSAPILETSASGRPPFWPPWRERSPTGWPRPRPSWFPPSSTPFWFGPLHGCPTGTQAQG